MPGVFACYNYLMSLRAYIPAFIVLVIIGVLHFLGTYQHLYFIFPLYDVPAHFFGGLWAGLTAVWFLKVFFKDTRKSFTFSLVWTLSAVLFFAVVWEMFELYSGIANPYILTVVGISYWADTAKDLAMGLLGGVAAFLFTRRA